ncbi:4-hydroxythreonine-4-phosphate dehydrogenase [Rhodanobacter lindaniclasticus]
MMLASPQLRVALATTHLPLAAVPAAITPALLARVRASWMPNCAASSASPGHASPRWGSTRTPAKAATSAGRRSTR